MSSLDGAITNLVSAQRGALGSTIGYAVAAKQLDALEQQGQAVNELLETSVQLSKAPGKGNQVDRQA